MSIEITTDSINTLMAVNENIWVLGGGKFGRRAVHLLQKRNAQNTITVIDRAFITDLPAHIATVRADAVEWLVEHLTPDASVNKIVPALPLHVVAEWAKMRLGSGQFRLESRPITDHQLHRLPNPIRVSSSRVVASHANFICPPDCPEPEKICTYTQMPRPQTMYSLLAELAMERGTPLVIRSRQFAPGVGGFFPEDLCELLDRIKRNASTPLLIATACACHAIIDGLEYMK